MVALTLISQQASHASQVSVSAAGTPSYSLPISVPPGVAGMAPNIGLLYSGGGVNGPVGYGWALQGISLITRCPGNKQIDGSVVPVRFNGNDKLCLDGQRLIQTNADGAVLNPDSMPFQPGDSLGGSGFVREYRTEKDMYARIRAYGMAGGNPANGPAYFKVWTKSGQIYEYGVNGNATANANIIANAPVDADGNYSATTRQVATAWPVSRIADTVGNYIDFQYEQRDIAWGSQTGGGPGHEWNLTEIRYTGTAAQAPMNRVVFEYTDRPDTPNQAQDRSEAYHNGAKNVSVRLLQKIHTYINWPAAQATQPASAIRTKVMKLSYDKGLRSGRSRVVKISECTGSNEQKCLPATTFDYSQGGGLAYSQNTNFSSGPLVNEKMLPGLGHYGAVVGSFFGSGRTDILRWSDNPGENRLYESTGKGNFSQSSRFNITDQNLFKSDGCYRSIVADFNGDGLSDILRTMQTTSVQSTSCGVVRNILYLSQGDGSFRPVDITGIDFTIKASVVKEHCIRGNCGGDMDNGQPTVPLSYSATQGNVFHVLDANGDGLLDIVASIIPAYPRTNKPPEGDQACATVICTRLYLGQASGGFIEASTNLAHRSAYTSTINLRNASPTVIDLNGDGLPDLAVDSGGWLSKGNGDFEYVALGDSCNNALDFNGDGKMDCVWPNQMMPLQHLWVSDSTKSLKQITNFNLISAGDELMLFLPYVSGSTGVSNHSSYFQTVDMDRDGRTDILRWGDDTNRNTVFLSNGDGTFRRSDTFNITQQLQHSDGKTTMLLGDFTGSGTTEILRLSYPSPGAYNLLFVRTDTTPPDQLMSVRTGNGITTSLNWVLLTSPNTGSLGPRYKSDRGTPDAAAYPMVDVLTPTYVVATVTTNAGFGGTLQKTEYAYSGMKMAYDGRGWLGFRSNAIQNTAPNDEYLTVTTQNIQNGPNPGPASMSETRRGALDQPSAPLLSRSSFIYCDKTATAGAQESATAGVPCATSAKVQRPYLYKSTEEGWDLEGVALPTVTTTNTFNNSGDAREILTVTSSASGAAQSSKRTTNDYLAGNTSGDSWILGRLKTATVLNDVSGSSSLLPTVSAGAPTSGSGTDPGVTPIQPAVNPAALMAIINLLLGDD
ncbi:VCBS repeat-containing protein [Massilia sp. LMS1-1-1.1]